jgi:dTDP-4-dehydrorhamnose reductase
MRWLVTGAGGLLGTELVTKLNSCAERVTALHRRELDLCDAEAVRAAIMLQCPDVVVNCAAWTDVDGAEGNEPAAMEINGSAVRELAAACALLGCILVHLSTDAVFDGAASAPYAEGARTAPINAYGRTKLAGEQAVLREHPQWGYVLRTAWLYGAHGRCFVGTIAALADQRGPVDVVDDQYGQPTWAADLADRIVALTCVRPPAGIYHATNAGQASRWELARELFTVIGADPERIRPVSSDQFPRAARRPVRAVLGHSRWALAGLPPMRPWQDALRRAVPYLRARP